MAEPTVTRKTLRQAIGRSARMQFFLRYPTLDMTFTAAGDSNAAANSTEVFYCNKLAQREGFWNNAYIYVMSTDSNVDGLERRIPNFNADKNALYLEYPCDTDEVPSTLDTFELYDIWPPTQIHDAINDAIRDSWRSYPEFAIDESLVIQEDTKAYALTGFDNTVASVLGIWYERNGSRLLGEVTNVTASDNWADTTMDLSNVTASTSTVTNWKAGIYEGTGQGQLFTLATASTTTQLFTVTSTASAWTNPDTTSKFAIWNTEEESNWRRIHAATFDKWDYPSTVYLQGEPSEAYGLRLRVIYIAEPGELTADTATTVVPRYFILHKALSFLHDSLSEDNRVDSRRHMELAENHDQLARDYALRHPRRYPPYTLWGEEDNYDGYMDDVNPLGW